MNFVDLWGWFNRFEQDAYRAGDTERQRLIKLYRKAWKELEPDPAAGLAMLDEGRALAEKLREPCMMLFFDYWRAEANLFYLNNIAAGLDIAVRIGVEAYKPLHRSCPVRARVLFTLAKAYMMVDPLGYASKIYETLDYLEKEVELDEDTWQRIEGERATLANLQGRLDASEAAARRYLGRCQGNNFRLSHGYSLMCDISYDRRKFKEALDYATLGEEAARRAERKVAAIEFLCWQALLTRKTGDEEAAQKLYKTVTTNIAWYESKPSSQYYYTLCEFHEFKHEYALALQLRDRQLKEVLESGSIHKEVQCRLRRCRLLVKMGRPVQEELALARAAANCLRDPKPMLAKLDAVELDSIGGCRALLSINHLARLLRAAWVKRHDQPGESIGESD